MTRSRRNAPIFAALLVLSLAVIVGCGGPRYAQYGALLGFREFLGWGVLADGATIDLAIVERSTGRPRPGIRMAFTDPRVHGPLTADARGIIAFPVSQSPLERNPRLLVEHASEVYLRFMTNVRCESFEGVVANQETRRIARAEYESWQRRERGTDVVLAEPSVSQAVVDRTAGDLVSLRVVLRDITGVEPPPIGVGLVLSEGRVRFAPDDKRTVVTVRVDAEDGLTTGPFVHAWTHAIVRSVVEYPVDQARFLEEGLVDVIAYKAREKLRHVTGTLAFEAHRRVIARRREEAPTKANVGIDLTKLGGTLDATGGPNLATALFEQCKKDEALGSALGFAIAFERGGREPAWIPRTLASLHEKPDADSWYAAVGKRTFESTAPGHITIEHALKVLGGPPP